MNEVIRKFTSNKLKQLMEEHVVTGRALSLATGIPESTLSDYIRGNSVPKPGNLQKLADFFGVAKSTLLPDINSYALDYPQASAPLYQDSLVQETGKSHTFPILEKYRDIEGLFYFIMRDHSMEGMFPLGSTLLINPDTEMLLESYYLVQINNANPLVRKLIQIDNQQFFSPLNPDQLNMSYSLTHPGLVVFGRVIFYYQELI